MADIMTPALGESVTEATVARWTKKAGDAVRKDEILVELETDKVSLEVAAPADGVLEFIAAEEGATVEPGAVLGRLAEGAVASAPAAASGGSVAIMTPTMGESVAEGSSFHRVLNDDAERGVNTAVKLVEPDKIRRVVLCSGKVYYDLLDAREEKGVDDVYIMRLEQFYPWPVKSLSTELSRFPNAELVWCQEEPKNMGGWTFVDPWLELTLERLKVKAKRARYVGRPASASTAAGLMSRHMKELQTFLAEAFA